MMNIQTMNRPAQAMKAQKGFTLIEIIAVLIVLAVLAAVAVPKYMDVVAEAKNASAEAAVAEGMARLNNAAAEYMILNGDNPTSLQALDILDNDADFTDAGDFTLGYVDNGSNAIDITATGTAAAVSGALATGQWVPAL